MLNYQNSFLISAILRLRTCPVGQVVGKLGLKGRFGIRWWDRPSFTDDSKKEGQRHQRARCPSTSFPVPPRSAPVLYRQIVRLKIQSDWPKTAAKRKLGKAAWTATVAADENRLEISRLRRFTGADPGFFLPEQRPLTPRKPFFPAPRVQPHSSFMGLQQKATPVQLSQANR